MSTDNDRTITPRWEFVEGSFNLDEVEMICLPSKKYGLVELCIREKRDDGFAATNFPIARLKIYSKDLFVEFKAVYDDTVKLGEEIAKRWNEEPIDALKLKNLVDSNHRLVQSNQKYVQEVTLVSEEVKKAEHAKDSLCEFLGIGKVVEWTELVERLKHVMTPDIVEELLKYEGNPE